MADDPGFFADVCKAWPEFTEVMTRVMGPGSGQKPLKILFLPSSSGEIIFELRFIRVLVRLGHKVIVALKEVF